MVSIDQPHTSTSPIHKPLLRKAVTTILVSDGIYKHYAAMIVNDKLVFNQGKIERLQHIMYIFTNDVITYYYYYYLTSVWFQVG